MDLDRFAHAVALRDAGNPEDALLEFEELASLELDPHDKGSLLGNQANCLWRLGRLKEARERLSEAASFWTTPFTEFLDACICVTEGKREEAVQKLTLFLKNHVDLKNSSDKDTYADAQDELGRLLFDLGRYADAIGPLEGALMLAEGEQRKRLSFYLGVCHRRSGNLTVAGNMLIQSLPTDKRDPWWVQAQYQLGCLYFQRGAYLDAKRAFEFCECFMEEADAELKQNVSGWISKTRAKLGQPDRRVD